MNQSHETLCTENQVAFTGTVTAVDPIPGTFLLTVDVAHVFMGQVPETVELTMGFNPNDPPRIETSCDVFHPYEVGMRLGVILSSLERRVVRMCSLVFPLREDELILNPCEGAVWESMPAEMLAAPVAPPPEHVGCASCSAAAPTERSEWPIVVAFILAVVWRRAGRSSS